LKPKSIEVDIVHVVFSISLKIRIRTEGAWEGCPSHTGNSRVLSNRRDAYNGRQQQ
jgi:hypothetical protein